MADVLLLFLALIAVLGGSVAALQLTGSARRSAVRRRREAVIRARNDLRETGRYLRKIARVQSLDELDRLAGKREKDG